MPDQQTTTVKMADPYSVLAAGYDVVMGHVDYGEWASYVQGLIESFHPNAERVLELGCGTGSLALELQPEESYEYWATDRSETMLKVARRKAAEGDVPIAFSRADFTDFTVDRSVDVVLLLYDGLNYLLDERNVARLFEQAYQALDERGLFIVDQTTPVNSEANEGFFDDEGTVGGFDYRRRSRYDPETRRHTTHFDITVNGTTYREEHVQRAYTISEIRSVIERGPFLVQGCFAGISRKTATEAAERVHWVLRKDME